MNPILISAEWSKIIDDIAAGLRAAGRIPQEQKLARVVRDLSWMKPAESYVDLGLVCAELASDQGVPPALQAKSKALALACKGVAS